jgi:hypothetical protein
VLECRSAGVPECWSAEVPGCQSAEALEGWGAGVVERVADVPRYAPAPTVETRKARRFMGEAYRKKGNGGRPAVPLILSDS